MIHKGIPEMSSVNSNLTSAMYSTHQLCECAQRSLSASVTQVAANSEIHKSGLGSYGDRCNVYRLQHINPAVSTNRVNEMLYAWKPSTPTHIMIAKQNHNVGCTM